MTAEVFKGRIACGRCKQPCLPDEMHSATICLSCYDHLQARNQGKPKPKGGNGSGEIKRNSMGWVEREERPIRSIDGDGFLVTDTKNASANISFKKPIAEEGIKVPDTRETLTIDADNKKPITEEGNIVSDTRIAALEASSGIQSELLAEALRRIRVLEEKLNPVMEREDAKANSAGLAKLRDDLEGLLKVRYAKNKIDAIYVSDLYGANGRKGGKLSISKMQAFRLRDACRTDDRFRVEKAENKTGKWLIGLNLKIR